MAAQGKFFLAISFQTITLHKDMLGLRIYTSLLKVNVFTKCNFLQKIS